MNPETYPHHPTGDLEEEMITDRLHGGIENGADKLSEDVEMINTIESRILEENPSLEGLDVSALASHDLVAVAERSIDDEMDGDFRKQAVEIVVTKGAREQLGKDQSSGENPIRTMALHGRSTEVVEAIETYATQSSATPEMAELAGAAAAVLDKTMDDLGIDAGADGSFEELIDHRVEASANYADNWSEAQRDRMMSADFQARYSVFIRSGAEGLSDTKPSSIFEKAGMLRQDYLAQNSALRTTIDEVTDHVEYDVADAFDRKPPQLGTMLADTDGKRVALFTDAVSDGQPLTDRQKDIIAAHEMYHGILAIDGNNRKQIDDAFSKEMYYAIKDNGNDVVSESYLFNPPELTARMAQLKNYFGMKGGEPFTQAHLEYARKHYVSDTQLDNSMTEFLAVAKDAEFVDAMNTFPV